MAGAPPGTLYTKASPSVGIKRARLLTAIDESSVVREAADSLAGLRARTGAA